MIDNYKELPLGLGFTLSMNKKAMENFSNMSDEKKQDIINTSRQVQSKHEMEELVNRIEKETFS